MINYNSILVRGKSLDIVSIHDSVLSSEIIDDLMFRLKRSLNGYRMRNTDWRIFDLIKEMPGIDDSTLRVMREIAVKHPEVTKCFQDPEATLENLVPFGGSSTRDFTWSKPFRIAYAILLKTFPPKRLVPLKLDEGTRPEEIFSDKTASAGAIGSGSKERNWEAIRDIALRMEDDIRHGVPFSHIWVPCVVYHRGQIHQIIVEGEFNPGYEEKNRAIWGSDGATTAIEARFAKPLIQYSKDGWFGYAGGKQPNVLRSNILKGINTRRPWISTDYSKFDGTIPDWLIHVCFNYVRSCYDPCYKKEIDWIEYNFINTKIILPNGMVLEKHKGIPSGSHFTQFIGSMANTLMMLTYLAAHGMQILSDDVTDEQLASYVLAHLSVPMDQRSLCMFVMGDDNLFFWDGELDLEDISHYVHKYFGVKINASKSLVGTDNRPHFLSRVWGDLRGEDRDQMDMCVQVMLPERVRDYKNYNPIDIMISLYYTFPLAFHADQRVMNRFFRDYYRSSGTKYPALTGLPKYEMPGSVRVFTKEAARNMQHYANLIVN